jgi:hypothetical protein
MNLYLKVQVFHHFNQLFIGKKNTMLLICECGMDHIAINPLVK